MIVDDFELILRSATYSKGQSRQRTVRSVLLFEAND